MFHFRSFFFTSYSIILQLLVIRFVIIQKQLFFGSALGNIARDLSVSFYLAANEYGRVQILRRDIDFSNIEACHRITKRNDRVIVKFSRRKDYQRVLSVKKNLQKLKMEDIVLTADNKVFINHSLYYRVLTIVYSRRNQGFFSIWGKSIG